MIDSVPMANMLSSAPVLSTPDSHILTEVETERTTFATPDLSDEQFRIRYEIDRTVREIRSHNWRKIALQCPDQLLPHSARISRMLQEALSSSIKDPGLVLKDENEVQQSRKLDSNADAEETATPVRITILGDTSYGSCCVDEIAGEHVDADVVVHYGRACLSPTARLPVLYIFTHIEVEIEHAVNAFLHSFSDPLAKVIVTADTPYASNVPKVSERLRQLGYKDIFAAEIVHQPSSVVPNRTVPATVKADGDLLREWDIFHIAEPPTSLLLTLTSKVKSIQIYIPPNSGAGGDTSQQPNTAMLLRRRYALITSMNTVSTWGILINTLSVKNYLHIVEHVKKQIADAGKKSYLFVVGKLNAAKVANFSEIGGWVVIGCWESSLIDSRDFYKPILTPFELELTLKNDDERVWTGAWYGDFQNVLDQAEEQDGIPVTANKDAGEEADGHSYTTSDEESEPPEFDLRTGKYVSRSRPMNRRTVAIHSNFSDGSKPSNALVKQHKGDMVKVNGVLSPAAEFLAQKRTWKGLGSDLEIQYDEEAEVEGGLIEEGRSGVARGYTIGNDSHKS